MKCIISPVIEAKVTLVTQNITRQISKGLLIYVGVSKYDIENPASYIEKMADKIINSKLFHSPQSGKIDASITDIGGEILCISNFTLYGDCMKGNKIDFGKSAKFEDAKKIYEHFCVLLKEKGVKVETGEFGAHMQIASINDGPLNYIFEF